MVTLAGNYHQCASWEYYSRYCREHVMEKITKITPEWTTMPPAIVVYGEKLPLYIAYLPPIATYPSLLSLVKNIYNNSPATQFIVCIDTGGKVAGVDEAIFSYSITKDKVKTMIMPYQTKENTTLWYANTIEFEDISMNDAIKLAHEDEHKQWLMFGLSNGFSKIMSMEKINCNKLHETAEKVAKLLGVTMSSKISNVIKSINVNDPEQHKITQEILKTMENCYVTNFTHVEYN